MKFYLGTHKVTWLERTRVPLFISRRTLSIQKHKIPRALGPWALDSGGFSELSLFGRWETKPRDYADEVLFWTKKVGKLEWAAVQDWMCEPIIRDKTRKSVKDHQKRTVESYMTLTKMEPHLRWVPVLQGWKPDEYLQHVEQYTSAGIDLKALKRVGVGSVCRRQGTAALVEVVQPLAALGIKLHGFGVKFKGLEQASKLFASTDSMAWSRQARFEPRLPFCTHKTCANCFHYAMRWRERLLGLSITHG